MIVHIWQLLIAVLLLWFPRQWLRLGGRVVSLHRPPSEKKMRDAGDASLKLRDEFPKPRNWVDFLRALVGGIGVYQTGLGLVPDAPKETATTLFVIQCAVLVVAVAIQTVRYQNRMTLVAPVFFISGLSFALIGWKAALFASVTIWVLNLLLPSAGVFLMVFAALEMGFSLVFPHHCGLKTAALSAGLAAAPVVFSAMTNRRLVKLNKKVRARPAKA